VWCSSCRFASLTSGQALTSCNAAARQVKPAPDETATPFIELSTANIRSPIPVVRMRGPSQTLLHGAISND
jgi:hypothetical protein